jgi:hypothetical protein
MPRNRLSCYADCALYPLLVAVMILVIADRATAIERALALVLALAVACPWTMLLRRFVLPGNARITLGTD